MKKSAIFTAVIIFMTFDCFVSAQDNFVYNDHGKRDPFVPLLGIKKATIGKSGIEGISSVGDVKFQGVARDSKGNKIAMLNGEMIQVGQTVSQVTLIKIEDDVITFTIDGETYSLSLYEKEGGLLSGK